MRDQSVISDCIGCLAIWGPTSATSPRWGQANFVGLHTVVKDQTLRPLGKDLLCQQLVWNSPNWMHYTYMIHHRGGIWRNPGLFTYCVIIWRLMRQWYECGLQNQPYGSWVQSFWKYFWIVLSAEERGMGSDLQHWLCWTFVQLLWILIY